VTDLETLEKDRKYVIRIANGLEERVKALKRFAERDDLLGIWLTTVALKTLVEFLDEFVEKKRKQKKGWESD